MDQLLCFLSGRPLFTALRGTRAGLEAKGLANDSTWWLCTKIESSSHTPQEFRENRRIVLSANNARQTDAALPTTADMSSPQTCEAGVTRRPAEYASRALSNGHSTTESMDTDPDDLGPIVTNRPAPSPLSTGPTFPDEQARQRIKSLEGYRRDELESTSHTPREVRETRHIILSADNARQRDAALPDISSPQPSAAGAARQLAESASYALSSGHNTVIKPMGVGTGNLRHREKRAARETIARLLNDYLEVHPEPIIGAIDNPFPFADKYGIKGISILSVFFDNLDMDNFTCRFCYDQHDSVDDALEHQRTARHYS